MVLGGSFTYGLGLPDEETLPWLMQQAYSELEWRNQDDEVIRRRISIGIRY